MAVLSLVAGPSTTVVLGGDLMLNGISPRSLPLSGIAEVLRRADVAIVNLEMPLTTARTATTRKSKAELARKDQWILKAEPDHARHLADSGIDLVALGNNHAMDYGRLGLDETTRRLKKFGIAYTGAGDAKRANVVTVYRTKGGLRVGLLSALAFQTAVAREKCSPVTDTAPGVAVIDTISVKTLKAWVTKAKTQCDLLIVGAHWGREKRTVPNPYQVSLGRALIDAGADVVWGHHPHVLQGAEHYRGKPIFYSLGNLISSRPGTSAVARLEYRNGKFKSLEWIPYRFRGGKTEKLAGADRPKALEAIDLLSEAVAKEYSHKLSKPLYDAS